VDDDDSDKDDPVPLNADGTATGSSLETLLVTRNKKLSNDLTILRVLPSQTRFLISGRPL